MQCSPIRPRECSCASVSKDCSRFVSPCRKYGAPKSESPIFSETLLQSAFSSKEKRFQLESCRKPASRLNPRAARGSFLSLLVIRDIVLPESGLHRIAICQEVRHYSYQRANRLCGRMNRFLQRSASPAPRPPAGAFRTGLREPE